MKDFEANSDPSCEMGWIAREKDGLRLGSIFCVKLDDQTAKLRLFLCMPEVRGFGLGKRLLAHCMAFAKARRFQRMSLWTHESHESACALYTRTGWACLSSKPVHSFGVPLIEQQWEITL
ncbi:GNAT family N-acetyltransferase [Planktotalea sp.]|uniref:GNAT family N-acetyltransferase n=1 Tax=Planktotalea sp. TaxID=2029877 RepID=UPI00341D61C9